MIEKQLLNAHRQGIEMGQNVRNLLHQVRDTQKDMEAERKKVYWEGLYHVVASAVCELKMEAFGEAFGEARKQEQAGGEEFEYIDDLGDTELDIWVNKVDGLVDLSDVHFDTLAEAWADQFDPDAFAKVVRQGLEEESKRA